MCVLPDDILNVNFVLNKGI